METLLSTTGGLGGLLALDWDWRTELDTSWLNGHFTTPVPPAATCPSLCSAGLEIICLKVATGVGLGRDGEAVSAFMGISIAGKGCTVTTEGVSIEGEGSLSSVWGLAPYPTGVAVVGAGGRMTEPCDTTSI